VGTRLLSQDRWVPALLQVLNSPQIDVALLGKRSPGHPSPFTGTPNDPSGDALLQLIVGQGLSVQIAACRAGHLVI
jgi:hypothetical protein